MRFFIKFYLGLQRNGGQTLVTAGVPFDSDLALLIGNEKIDSKVKSCPSPAVIHVLMQDPPAPKTRGSEVFAGNFRRRTRVQLGLQAKQMAPLDRDQRGEPRGRDDALLGKLKEDLSWMRE